MSKNIGIAYGFYKSSFAISNIPGLSTDHLFLLLKKSFSQRSIETTKIGLQDTQIRIFNNQLDVIDLNTQKSLLQLDGIYFANWRKQPEFSLAAAELMTRAKKPILSEEVLRIMPMTKLGEMIKLSDKNINLPNSVFMRSKYWLKLIKDNGDLPFDFPFIFKLINGSGGGDNYFIKSPKQLKRIIESNPERLFVAQEYIPNTHDFRVIMINGEVKLVIKRSRLDGNTHVNNTSQGAKGELISVSNIDKQIINLAIKAAKAAQRQSFCGADVIRNSRTGKYYVLEVNKAPQIETGTNTKEKVVLLTDYFSKKLEAQNEG